MFYSLALTCHEWEFEFLQRKVLLVKNAMYDTSIIWKSLKEIYISGENTILNLTEKKLAPCFINWSWYRTGWKHVWIHWSVTVRLSQNFDFQDCFSILMDLKVLLKLLWQFLKFAFLPLYISWNIWLNYTHFLDQNSEFSKGKWHFSAWTYWESEMKINTKLFEISIFWMRKADTA